MKMQILKYEEVSWRFQNFTTWIEKNWNGY